MLFWSGGEDDAGDGKPGHPGDLQSVPGVVVVSEITRAAWMLSRVAG